MMKQKFLLSKNMDKNEFTIEEQSELEPGKFIKLHKSDYELDTIQAAADTSPEKLKGAFRSASFFPATAMTNLIVTGINELLKSKTEDTFEVLTQDKDAQKEEESDKQNLDAEETVKLDTLLDDAIDDDEGLTEELEIESDDLDNQDAITPKIVKDKKPDTKK